MVDLKQAFALQADKTALRFFVRQAQELYVATADLNTIIDQRWVVEALPKAPFYLPYLRKTS